MALPAVVDLTAYRGDTWSQTFRFLEAGAPVDLTNATVASWAKTFDGSHVELIVEKGDPGEVTIELPAEGLDCGAWAYDVEVTDGEDVTTWVKGTLTVEGDVTNAAA